MLGRVTAVSALMLLASLAGCLSKDQAPETITAENTTALGVVDAENASKAPDGRGDISAFKETNRTETMGTGAMDHMHDYWEGETRRWVTDIQVSLIPLPVMPCSKQGGGCTAGQAQPGTDTLPPGTAIADFDIPNDNPGYGLVYEGTSSIELLPNYIDLLVTGDDSIDPDHSAAHVYFQYLSASDEPGAWRTGGELKVGTPFILNVAPTEVDMPHQTKSLWLFRIYSDSSTVTFNMNLTLTAVKGGAVVNWPPHPDLYAEKPERIIFDGPIHMESKGTVDSNVYGSDAGWLNPEKVLSWGTDRIEITVTGATLTTDPPGIPSSGYVFEYHNASKPPLMGNGAQYGGRLVDDGSDGTTWTYMIDISNDPSSYDTPYGDKSRWGFRFVPQFDQGGAVCYDDEPFGSFLQQLLVGCQIVPWSLDYTMTVKAYGHSTATEVLPDNSAGTASS